MVPDVGTTCKFSFTSKFSTLDGFYRVRAETTFKDAVASGIDFVDNLYIPAGLTQLDFAADFSSYTNDAMVTLESVSDSDVVYYVPESLFLYVPDPTAKEYFPLMLLVDLGVQENTQRIYPLLDLIKDAIQASLGTEDPLRIITNPDNKVYLTSQEYDTLIAERQQRIKDLVPLSVQLKSALDKNIFLAAKIAEYERFLAETATSSS